MKDFAIACAFVATLSVGFADGELTFVAEAHPRTQAAVPVSHAAAERSAN